MLGCFGSVPVSVLAFLHATPLTPTLCYWTRVPPALAPLPLDKKPHSPLPQKPLPRDDTAPEGSDVRCREIGIQPQPPASVIPLGTGNGMSVNLGWGHKASSQWVKSRKSMADVSSPLSASFLPAFAQTSACRLQKTVHWRHAACWCTFTSSGTTSASSISHALVVHDNS